MDRQRNDCLGRCRFGRRCEHRRKILRCCRGSDTHANTFSDPNRDSYADCNCNGYGDRNANNNINSYSTAYCYAQSNSAAASDATTSPHTAAMREWCISASWRVNALALRAFSCEIETRVI
jgi:hypothetical protein